MRIRKLLLIHSGRAQIDSGRFDVIIVAEYLNDMELNDFGSNLETIKTNGRSDLIVISDSESDQAREDLVLQGFTHVVQTRIRPADIIKQINAVCDPRKWRKDARYHIPHTGVVITSPHQEMAASLINISLGGIFVELTTQDPSVLMNGGLSLTLHIPMSESTAQIDGLTIKLLRVETVGWTKGYLPRTMRATFIFVDLNPRAQGNLQELIQMAKEEKLSATEVKG